jgi:8-oxo-dGTP pyrophosphatase MutT (NUDIX family)
VVVVRSGPRFLLVQEAKHEQRWYFPAGHLEVGEGFAEAALREVREEAGIEVQLQGILRLEHEPRTDGTARIGVVYVARPVKEGPLKSTADENSLQAAWVSLCEMARYPVRGPEVPYVMGYVLDGPTIYPLEALQRAGTAIAVPVGREALIGGDASA